MIVLYILLFVLFLSILIMIHEAGHLIAAKTFNVYCFDYSLGFGPALFRKKRKNGETYFSIRAIPFGGFVSMYGEEADQQDLPGGVKDIPKERSLNNIKKWKRAIVLLAGVTMNAILAIILFFVAALLPQRALYLRYVEVKENSIAAEAGLLAEKPLYFYEASETFTDYNDLIEEANKKNLNIIDIDSLITKNDDSTVGVITVLNSNKLTFKNKSFDNSISFYLLKDNYHLGEEYNYKDNNIKKVNFTIYQLDVIGEGDEPEYIKDEGHPIEINNSPTGYEEIGLDTLLVTRNNNFPEALGQTFNDFGRSSTLIFRTLGGLFIGRGWGEIGGIVAIYGQSTLMITSFDLTHFIFLWAVISVNLAIMNLLPFPGLDGWQLVVLTFEAITKRDMPTKAKAIASIIGISLLMVLMVFVLVKDVIGLFI